MVLSALGLCDDHLAHNILSAGTLKMRKRGAEDEGEAPVKKKGKSE